MIQLITSAASKLIKGHRPLGDIVATFQRTHDELKALEDGHAQRAADHGNEIEDLSRRIMHLQNERDAAARIRNRLRDFIPTT